MKKKYKWLIWIGGFVLLAVLSISASVFISEYSRDPVFDPTPLIGLTKDEVLTLAFAKCSNATTGRLFIDVQELNNAGSKYLAGHEFETLADAKSAAVLKDRDIWELDEIKVSTSSFPFSARERLVLYFTDGRVVKVGTSLTSDM
jgi:hypothetical protein